MKFAIKRLVPGVLLFLVLGSPALAQTRVATVNLPKVFEKYWKTEQAVQVLTNRAAQLYKTQRELNDGVKKAREEYQKLLEDANNQAVSSEEREKRKRAAETKLKSISSLNENAKEFERSVIAQLADEKDRWRKRILDEILLAVTSKAKAGNYALVLDAGSKTYVPDVNGTFYYTPAILFSADENDLTEAVISQLNASAPVDLSGSGEKKGNAETPPK